METVTSTDSQNPTPNVLFCRACQAVYQQPKLLPCLHSFCRPCIVHAVTNGTDGTFIVCPLCSHKSQLPASGVVGVPDNIFLNRMCQEYLTEVQNHLVSRSLNNLNPRRSLELTSSTDVGSATPGQKYPSLSSFWSQNRTQEFSQSVEDDDTAAGQSPVSSYSFGRGSPSGQSTENTLEAIRNMNRLQTKVMSLQGEALRVTYAIDEVNQSMVDWHQHKDDMKKVVERRTAQFQFYLKRMEHQLIAQIDSKQTDDLFYTESDKSKTELRKILNNILHEVSVLKNMQEFGKDAEINSLSPILLGRSFSLAEVALKKLHFDMEVPNSTIEEIVGDSFGVIRFNSEESKVYVPEVSDFNDVSVGTMAQTLTGDAKVAGNIESRETVVKKNEEAENAPTSRTQARRSIDRRSRRHNTDLGLDKPDVKEYLAQFQNARENLRAKRKEILERGRQASEDASPLRDEIHRRPRSTSRTGRVQSLDRVALPVPLNRRATLPSGLTLHEIKSITVEPETLSPTLQEKVSHFQYEPTDKFQHGLESGHSISGLANEDQTSASKEHPMPSSHQRTLVKQASEPRYTRELPTSPKEDHSSEIVYTSHSQSFIEELRNRRFSNPSNSFFERRFSEQLNSLPQEETEDLHQYDRDTTRPVRRAISSATDRKAKIDFLRENWQKRKELLIQNEGFVSPDTIKQVVKPPSEVQLSEEEDDSKVLTSKTVDSTEQDHPSPPPVTSPDPKIESMHTIRSRVAQYRTELTKNNDTSEQEVKTKAPVSPSIQTSEHFRFDTERQKYSTGQTQVSPVFKATETTSPASQTVPSAYERIAPPLQPGSYNLTNQTASQISAHQVVSQVTTNQTASQIPSNQIEFQPTNQKESRLYTNQTSSQRFTYETPLFQRSTNETPLFQRSTNETPLFQRSTNETPLFQRSTNETPLFQRSTNETPLFQRSTNETPLIPKYKTLTPTNDIEPHIPTNQHVPISTTTSTNIQEKPSVSAFTAQTTTTTTATPVTTATTTATPVTTATTTTTPTYSRYSRYHTKKVETIDIASLIAAMYSGNETKILHSEPPKTTSSQQPTTTQAASITTGNTLPTESSRATETTSSTSTRLTTTPFTYASRYQTESKSQLAPEKNENQSQQDVFNKSEQTSKAEQESLTRPYRYTGLYSRYNKQDTNSINTTAVSATTTAISNATSTFTPTESILTRSSATSTVTPTESILSRSSATSAFTPAEHIQTRYSVTNTLTRAENIHSKSSIEVPVTESPSVAYGSQEVVMKNLASPTEASPMNISEKSEESTQQVPLRSHRYGLYSRYSALSNTPTTTSSTNIVTSSLTAAENTSSVSSTSSSMVGANITPSEYQTEHLKETPPPEQVTSAKPKQSDEPTKESQLKPSRSKMRSRFTDGVNRRHTIEIGKDAIQSALKLYSKDETEPVRQTTLDPISESPATTHTSAYTPYSSRLSDSLTKVRESSNGSTPTLLSSAKPLEASEIKDTIISYKIRASGVTTKIIPTSLEVIQEKSHNNQSQTPKATSDIAPAPATPPSPSLLSLSPDEIAQKVKLREIARKKKERWRHMTIH